MPLIVVFPAAPVIKTVLKFAANRIVFNPMEAMNLAVASEGMDPGIWQPRPQC